VIDLCIDLKYIKAWVKLGFVLHYPSIIISIMSSTPAPTEQITVSAADEDVADNDGLMNMMR
jgi:hypothetical protein